MDIIIGKCGIACGVCKNYNNGCLGCEKENSQNDLCLIFRCAEEKAIRYCLQCGTYPCSLMRGLSKSYCPVFSKIEINTVIEHTIN
ncbi:MAG: DUF3795 domain-containing protein [Candidatus Methanoperedens sp.]